MNKELILVLLILLLTNCRTKSAGSEPEVPEVSGGTMHIRFLALGDSYTIGESVAESERWPNQLAAALLRKGYAAEVTIIARTGWTTDELWDGIQKAAPQPPYDLVSLLIGVNNQYRGYDIGEFRKSFRSLLNKAIEYSGGDKNRVFVVSIPDWGVTPFAAGRDAAQISSEIDAFNETARHETAAAGVIFIDITAASRQALDNPSLTAFDGLHPSGKMYGLWVEKISPQVIKALE